MLPVVSPFSIFCNTAARSIDAIPVGEGTDSWGERYEGLQRVGWKSLLNLVIRGCVTVVMVTITVMMVVVMRMPWAHAFRAVFFLTSSGCLLHKVCWAGAGFLVYRSTYDFEQWKGKVQCDLSVSVSLVNPGNTGNRKEKYVKPQTDH